MFSERLDPTGIWGAGSAWQVRSLGGWGEEKSTFQLSDALGVSREPRLSICKEVKQLNANNSYLYKLQYLIILGQEQDNGFIVESA